MYDQLTQLASESPASTGPPTPAVSVPSPAPQATTTTKRRNTKAMVTSVRQTAGHRGVSRGVNPDAVASLPPHSDLRAHRDQIEDTTTLHSTLRLTETEREAAEDCVRELRRQFRVKTSMNEIARLGMRVILDDYAANGSNSLIYRVKKS